jgi:ADP-ribose pyrophosphatase YjhB (NUDIX family)
MPKNNSSDATYKYLSLWDPINSKITPPIQVASCFMQLGDKILLLQRAKKDEQFMLWGIPAGKLQNGEIPTKGLAREILEETDILLDPESFILLGTALSRTSCDGLYGLYIYYVRLHEEPKIKITEHEHSAYKWVTIPEFESFKLLTAQFEAYKFVREKLNKISELDGHQNAKQF